MTSRTATRVAALAWGLGLAATAAIVMMLATDGALAPDLVSEILFVLSFLTVGAIVASRRPDNPIGWLFIVVGYGNLVAGLCAVYAGWAYGCAGEVAVCVPTRSPPPGAAFASWLGQWAWVVSFAALGPTLVLFPDGKPPSRLWRWVSRGFALPAVAFGVGAIGLWRFRGPQLLGREEPSLGFLDVIGPFAFGALLLLTLASVVALLLRFRRSRGIERAQLKWVSYAAAFSIAMLLVDEFATDNLPLSLDILSIPGVPIAAGLAISRYRLFDIDRLVSRTLGYGLVTAALAVMYAGAVVVLRAVLRPMTGESGLAVAAATLAVAAAFNPVRRRVQLVVDRRFNRSRYDAVRTIDAFSARLRDEVDLETLSRDLLAVVQQTMQPATASLWLRSG